MVKKKRENSVTKIQSGLDADSDVFDPCGSKLREKLQNHMEFHRKGEQAMRRAALAGTEEQSNTAELGEAQAPQREASLAGNEQRPSNSQEMKTPRSTGQE